MGTSRRLATLLEDKLQLTAERMRHGPPAHERFPKKALRYRDWGKETRWGRGDAYPLYTLDTMRNLADHLFDWTSGYRSGAARAAQVRPCDLVYSTLRPTAAFAQKVHAHIRVPYLLVTGTADEPITPGRWVSYILGSKQLWRWWAVDNELAHPKLDQSRSASRTISSRLAACGNLTRPSSTPTSRTICSHCATRRRSPSSSG